jgi:hypothetical protein
MFSPDFCALLIRQPNPLPLCFLLPVMHITQVTLINTFTP